MKVDIYRNRAQIVITANDGFIPIVSAAMGTAPHAKSATQAVRTVESSEGDILTLGDPYRIIDRLSAMTNRRAQPWPIDLQLRNASRKKNCVSGRDVVPEPNCKFHAKIKKSLT